MLFIKSVLHARKTKEKEKVVTGYTMLYQDTIKMQVEDSRISDIYSYN